MRLSSAVCIVVSVVISARAARAEDCAASSDVARRNADKQVKAGEAKAALASLDAVKDRCFTKLPPAAKLWLLSEMAFAAHAAGANDRCSELILEADDDAMARNPKISKALLYNAGLCKPKDGCDYKLDQEEPVCKVKLALEYGERNDLKGYEARPCDVAGHKDAVAIAPGSCIEVSEFKKRGEDDAVCGTFKLVDAKGKTSKLGFGKDGGWVNSPSDCCAVREIKVKTERGKTAVLVGSREISRDCFGGTASSDFLTLFDLVGDQLISRRDYTINWH